MIDQSNRQGKFFVLSTYFVGLQISFTSYSFFFLIPPPNFFHHKKPSCMQRLSVQFLLRIILFVRLKMQTALCFPNCQAFVYNWPFARVTY